MLIEKVVWIKIEKDKRDRHLLEKINTKANQELMKFRIYQRKRQLSSFASMVNIQII